MACIVAFAPLGTHKQRVACRSNGPVGSGHQFRYRGGRQGSVVFAGELRCNLVLDETRRSAGRRTAGYACG